MADRRAPLTFVIAVFSFFVLMIVAGRDLLFVCLLVLFPILIVSLFKLYLANVSKNFKIIVCLILVLAIPTLIFILVNIGFITQTIYDYSVDELCFDQLKSAIFDPKAAFQLLTALVTLGGLIAAYKYWTGERILELNKEYDELADARKIFWNSIDIAYKMSRLSSDHISNKLIQSSSTPTVDSFIRGLLFDICKNYEEDLNSNPITTPRLKAFFRGKLNDLAKARPEGAKEIDENCKIDEIEENRIIYNNNKPMYLIIDRGEKLWVYYIFRSIYPLGFDPNSISEIPGKDLLSNVKRQESEWKNNADDKNIKKLWKLARFIYPSKEDYENYEEFRFSNLVEFKTQYFKNFDIARGNLSRFWNKWASQGYARREILKNHLGAHEQLIMLTWLELALVRQINDYGKGKVHLFKIAKQVDDDIYKKLTGTNRKK